LRIRGSNPEDRSGKHQEYSAKHDVPPSYHLAKSVYEERCKKSSFTLLVKRADRWGNRPDRRQFAGITLTQLRKPAAGSSAMNEALKEWP
jgi:hypothetical protein